MIPELKIEFLEEHKIPDAYGVFDVDADCKCYWLEGGNEILVALNTENDSSDKVLDVILISFNFIKCVDPDGGHQWLDTKLKKLIGFLVQNRQNFFN